MLRPAMFRFGGRSLLLPSSEELRLARLFRATLGGGVWLGLRPNTVGGAARRLRASRVLFGARHTNKTRPQKI